MIVIVTKRGELPNWAPIVEGYAWRDAFEQERTQKMPSLNAICLADENANTALERWNRTNPLPAVLYEFGQNVTDFVQEYVSFRQVAFRAEKLRIPTIPLISERCLTEGYTDRNMAGVLKDIAGRSALVLSHPLKTAPLAESLRQCDRWSALSHQGRLRVSDISIQMRQQVWEDMHQGGKSPFDYARGVPRKAVARFTYTPMDFSVQGMGPDTQTEKIEYELKSEPEGFLAVPKRREQLGLLSLVYSMRRAYYEEGAHHTSLELVLS